jgi:hypothetical protein
MKKIISLLVLSITFTMVAPVGMTTAQAAVQQSPAEQVQKAKEQSKAVAENMKARQDSLRTAQKAQQAVYDEQNKSSERFIWIIVACGAIFSLIFLWVKYGSVVMGIIRILTGNYRIKGDVTTLEAKKILTGAIYADQQGAYLNTLKADVGGKLFTILGEWWGINGRDSAIETLDYLRDKAFAYYFPTVYKAVQAGSDSERKEIITAAMTNQEDAEKAYSQTSNLLESVEVLKKYKLIHSIEDVEKRGVRGWDVGRLIFIARLCYDAKYITEQEAWEYIDVAYEQAQKEFNSWEELAKSYVIGRFLWKGPDANDGMIEIADDLVNKPKSPWTQVAWK